jgi:DNA-binding MarR family transcriptional regulator
MKATPKLSDATAGERDLAISVDALRRILRELRVVARKSELAAGLSAAQVFVLTALASGERLSINDVAAATMTDRSSVAAVVERLVELGYAVRTQSPEDRRRADVSITARGRQALRRSAPPPTSVLIDAIRGMPETDRRSLAQGLGALAQRMGIAHAPAGMLFEDSPRSHGRRGKDG